MNEQERTRLLINRLEKQMRWQIASIYLLQGALSLITAAIISLLLIEDRPFWIAFDLVNLVLLGWAFVRAADLRRHFRSYLVRCRELRRSL